MPSTLTRPQFDQAFSCLRPGLVRYAARLTARQEAEDLAQDVYVQAVSLLDRYDADTGLAGLARWLARIVTYACREHNRRVIERNEILLSETELTRRIDTETYDRCHPDAPSPCNDDPGLLHHADLVVAAMPLSPRRREIWRTWSQGATQTEIARELHLSQPTVSYHLSHVMTALRDHAGDTIGAADGYRSAVDMFNQHARVTRYRRPTRRGSQQSIQQLRRLK